MSYKFLYDPFEIRGKNLPDGKFGKDGGGLREELKGCGGWVDKWGFERTPDDPNYEWFANGRVASFQGECVGNALETAGENEDGNCHVMVSISTAITADDFMRQVCRSACSTLGRREGRCNMV